MSTRCISNTRRAGARGLVPEPPRSRGACWRTPRTPTGQTERAPGRRRSWQNHRLGRTSRPGHRHTCGASTGGPPRAGSTLRGPWGPDPQDRRKSREATLCARCEPQEVTAARSGPERRAERGAERGPARKPRPPAHRALSAQGSGLRAQGSRSAPAVAASHPLQETPWTTLRPRDLHPARIDTFARSTALVRPWPRMELRVQPRRSRHLLRIGGCRGSRLRHGVLGHRVRPGPQLQQALGFLRRRRSAAHGGTDAHRRRTRPRTARGSHADRARAHRSTAPALPRPARRGGLFRVERAVCPGHAHRICTRARRPGRRHPLRGRVDEPHAVEAVGPAHGRARRRRAHAGGESPSSTARC